MFAEGLLYPAWLSVRESGSRPMTGPASLFGGHIPAHSNPYPQLLDVESRVTTPYILAMGCPGKTSVVGGFRPYS